jgi:translation initiation factor 3 subunit G
MTTVPINRKWADVDEEDEEVPGSPTGKSSGLGGAGTRFETKPDQDGIKTVVEYVEKNGQTYKVTRRVKVTTVIKRMNAAIKERRSLQKFGKAATCDERTEASLCTKTEEEVPIELTKKHTVSLSAKDDAEAKFFEQSLAITESLFKEKKVWTDMNRERQVERDTSATPAVEEKKTDAGASAAPSAAAAPGAAQEGKYLPPSLRGKGDGKGGKDSKGPDQEASLRITNLSESCREGDLQDLFSTIGRLQRVYLAKDLATGLSRGFAFVTYYTREDAQKAIDKLNKHPYDNLILQVQFAKPRT